MARTLPCELWATVEPCDEREWVIGPPVDVRTTHERGSVAASIEEPL
jgi:hypothetical protein